MYSLKFCLPFAAGGFFIWSTSSTKTVDDDVAAADCVTEAGADDCDVDVDASVDLGCLGIEGSAMISAAVTRACSWPSEVFP